MWKSPRSAAAQPLPELREVPNTPFEAVARMTASPAATAVTTPVALTDAMAGRLLLQVNVAPLMGALAISNADAVSETFPPTGIEVLAGATVTLATTGGGGASGLQAPKLEVPDTHTPAAFRCSEVPIEALLSSPMHDVGGDAAGSGSAGCGDDAFIGDKVQHFAEQVDQRDGVRRAVLNAVRRVVHDEHTARAAARGQRADQDLFVVDRPPLPL